MKLIRIITVFTVLCAIITVVSMFTSFLLPLYLSYRFNMDVEDAGSAGIIGGADGPTAVIITGQSASYLYTVIFSLLTILGVIYQVIVMHKSKA